MSWRGAFLLAAGVTVATAAAASGAEPVGAGPLNRLGWLAGCWQQEKSGRVTQEQWMAPLGGTMLGVGRIVSGGRTVEYEYLHIEEKDGALVYTAHPSGQPSDSFRQIEITDDKIVFANPEHDFPQRIRYTRVGPDSLLAQIEGERNGATRVIDYPMARVACGAAAAGEARH